MEAAVSSCYAQNPHGNAFTWTNEPETKRRQQKHIEFAALHWFSAIGSDQPAKTEQGESLHKVKTYRHIACPLNGQRKYTAA